MLRFLSLAAVCSLSLFGLPGCAVKTKVVASNLNVPAGATFVVAATNFDDAMWSNLTEKQAAKIRKNEDKWLPAVGSGFNLQVKRERMAGDGNPVQITINELKPGNRWLRWFWGWYGAGNATTRIHFDCGSCGSFDIEGRLKTGGWMGGRVDNFLKTVGKRAAKHLADPEPIDPS